MVRGDNRGQQELIVQTKSRLEFAAQSFDLLDPILKHLIDTERF
jgi:hypothetical protein